MSSSFFTDSSHTFLFWETKAKRVGKLRMHPHKCMHQRHLHLSVVYLTPSFQRLSCATSARISYSRRWGTSRDTHIGSTCCLTKAEKTEVDQNQELEWSIGWSMHPRMPLTSISKCGARVMISVSFMPCSLNKGSDFNFHLVLNSISLFRSPNETITRFCRRKLQTETDVKEVLESFFCEQLSFCTTHTI